jgi:uncharacterized membrane protein YcgQ (UPF0703/DUF1980 family)
MNKRVMGLLLLLAMAAMLLTGCQAPLSAEAQAEAEVTAAIPVDLEIREKMFIAQSNDVYVNYPDYLGKTIKYEGMFFGSYYEMTDTTFYSVVRYGPGCCGYDGNAGFEVAWDEGQFETPEDNDWVEVIGMLEEYEELGARYLRLRVLNMREMATRGAETVLQ